MIKGAPMLRTALSSVAIVLGLAFVLPAWAAVDRAQATALAQHMVPGRVLAVERGLYVDNTVIWRIKVLTASGEIREVVIDAQTGKPR
jgi:thiamine transporter ThiT